MMLSDRKVNNRVFHIGEAAGFVLNFLIEARDFDEIARVFYDQYCEYFSHDEAVMCLQIFLDYLVDFDMVIYEFLQNEDFFEHTFFSNSINMQNVIKNIQPDNLMLTLDPRSYLCLPRKFLQRKYPLNTLIITELLELRAAGGGEGPTDLVNNSS